MNETLTNEEEGIRDEAAMSFLKALLNDPVWRREAETDANKYRDFRWAEHFAERAYMMGDAMVAARREQR